MSAITGGVWTVYEHWLQEKPPKWLMSWHQGDAYFGAFAPADAKVFFDRNPSWPAFLQAVPLTRYWRFEYMAILAVAGFLHFCLGVNMLATPWSKQVAKQRSFQRWLHHVTALMFSWPLALTIVTGAAYRLMRMSGFEKADTKWILLLHQVSIATCTFASPLIRAFVHSRALLVQGYFSAVLPYYPIVICLSVLLFLATGIYMNPTVRIVSKRCCAGKNKVKKAE
jgi:hypothetical protein